MSLKDVMRDDLMRGRVWFNAGEMADEHIVNGQKIICVVDGASMGEGIAAASQTGENRRRGEGVMNGALDLYLRRDEYRGLPRIGQAVTLDGRSCRITAYADDEGVLCLSLLEVRSRC